MFEESLRAEAALLEERIRASRPSTSRGLMARSSLQPEELPRLSTGPDRLQEDGPPGSLWSRFPRFLFDPFDDS